MYDVTLVTCYISNIIFNRIRCHNKNLNIQTDIHILGLNVTAQAEVLEHLIKYDVDLIFRVCFKSQGVIGISEKCSKDSQEFG